MTEAEAKTKWCPMVRIAAVGSTGNIAVNRIVTESSLSDQIEHSLCIGSQCMMWRYHFVNIKGEPVRLRGYCGLAGKP